MKLLNKDVYKDSEPASLAFDSFCQKYDACRGCPLDVEKSYPVECPMEWMFLDAPEEFQNQVQINSERTDKMRDKIEVMAKMIYAQGKMPMNNCVEQALLAQEFFNRDVCQFESQIEDLANGNH